jgi:hypothetical protein
MFARLRVRTTLASLGIELPFIVAVATAFVACSGSSGSGGGGPDATGDSVVEGGGGDTSDSSHDASVDGDASPVDADASTGPDADGSPADVAEAAPMELADAFSGDCGAGPSGEPLDLSCTGLYSDFPSKTVAADLQAYAPGLVLWSDGAEKLRWIYLPAGQKIDTSNMDEWTFPVGTKIWKEFSLPLGDASTPTRIETRLLWKQSANLWYRTTYRWTDDGTSSATELIVGQLDAGGTGYEVPNQGECDSCHNGRIDGVLGFEAVSLAAPAATGLTLSALEGQSLLTDLPDASLVVPGDPTQSAAIGWMHANCGTACHNKGNGAAQFTGFFMRLDVATLASVQATGVYTTGWNVQTQGFLIPGATTTYRLHACDTASSCAYYRPDHRDGVDGTPGGVQMPPIDSHKVDDVAVAQIAAWINEGCDAGTDAADQ